ncbi:MAG: diguanylate cyclase, partial [Nonlabens ulvanivorans]|uniref:GGDEF domain-containing protein n=1 Tax=Nonlabens ulvanivorans TaxID=906888 RepID=UPI0032675510
VLARLSGNQFAALIKTDTLNAAKTKLQTLQQAANQLEIKDNDKQTTFSVCIGATNMKGENTMESFFKIASDALNTAKKEGKNKLILTEMT